ncbi:MAG: response regulator transcription factor [Chloroflexi bacterium]|nr:response regulator transcription factor [Chloroflexota bacterium]
MPPKRILLLSNRSLLASGVQRLLEKEEGIELFTAATGDGNAPAKVRQWSPEVIVLDSGDPSMGEGMVTRLLEQFPGARVVAVGLEQEGINVYRMQRLVQTTPSELLAAIYGKGAPSARRRPRKGGDVRTGDTGGATMGQ